MMKPATRYLAALTLLVLTACASLGIQPAQSIQDKIAYSYGTHTAVLQAATKAVQAGTLSSTDAGHVLALADQSRLVLDAAKAALGAGNQADATRNLALAVSLLSGLQSYLNTHGSTP